MAARTAMDSFPYFTMALVTMVLELVFSTHGGPYLDSLKRSMLLRIPSPFC